MTRVTKAIREDISRNIDRWTAQQHYCAKLFTWACTVPEDKAVEYAGVSSATLTRWREQGLIEKVSTPKASFYRPTEYGKLHFSEATGNRCYNTNNESWRHNYKLLDVVHHLTPEEQDSYKTETDLKREATERGINLKECSLTDGAYIDSETGETVMIEIETSAYTNEHIRMKEHFCAQYGGTYDPHR